MVIRYAQEVLTALKKSTLKWHTARLSAKSRLNSYNVNNYFTKSTLNFLPIGYIIMIQKER